MLHDTTQRQRLKIMPRQTKRQPRLVQRAVISVSLPLKPDAVNAQRAAGMLNQTVSAFIRDAVNDRAAKVLAGEIAPMALRPTG